MVLQQKSPCDLSIPIDGNHSFTISSVHTFFFKNTISEYCGSPSTIFKAYDKALEEFSHTDQLFGQVND